MSIIQDALKRQQEDSPESRPESPAEMPGLAGQGEESPPKKSKKGPWLGILITVFVLLAAGTGAYIFYEAGVRGLLEKLTPVAGQDAAAPQAEVPGESEPQSDAGALVGQVEDVVAATQAELESDAEEDESGTPDELAGVADADRGEKGADVEVMVDNEAAVGRDAGSEDDLQANEESEPPVVERETPSAPQPEAPVAPPKEPVFWPGMHVKGIMAPSTGNSGTVLLDSSMLTEGDSYKGVRILKISRSSVLLEFQGEKRLVNTGQTIGD